MIYAIILENPVWLAGQDLTHHIPPFAYFPRQPAFSFHFNLLFFFFVGF